MTEVLAALLTLFVCLLFTKRLHPEVNRFPRLAFFSLLFMFCLGPIYLSVKLMGIAGQLLMVGLPAAAGILSKGDSSRWVFSGCRTYFNSYRLRVTFIAGMMFATVVYASYQVFAAFKMGQWDDSYWIFNFDNAQRLQLAWRIFYSSSYPPDWLYVPTGAGHHYHYASASLGPFFSKLASLDVATAYLRLTSPLLLIPAVIAPVVVAYSRTRSWFIATIPLLLVSLQFVEAIPISLLRGFVFDSYNIVIGIYSGDWQIVRDVLRVGKVYGSAQLLGNAVLDGANVANLAYSCLFMSAFFGFRRKALGWLFVGITPICVMMNSRLLSVAVVLILSIGLWAAIEQRAKLGGVLLFGMCMGIALLAVFGSGIIYNIPGLDFSLAFNSFGEISIVVRTVVVLIVIFVFYATIIFSSSIGIIETNASSSFVNSFSIVSIIIIIGFAVLQPLLNGHYNLYSKQLGGFFEITTLKWLVFVFLLSPTLESRNGLMSFRGSGNSFFLRMVAEKISVGILIVGFVLSMFHGYHASIQLLKISIWPSTGHEASNLSGQYECLERIENNGILTTNNLRYPAQNYNRKRMTAAVLHLKGHYTIASIGKSSELLSDPNITLKKLALHLLPTETTHIFLDKAFLWPKVLKEFITFENEVCAVVPVDERWLR